jgi:putative nucleotidyltransferase with HDIG domain
MKTGISLFKSKVAKRIFISFLLCAMLPVAVFSIISFTQVSGQLREQSMTRLQNSAKTYGLGIFERFLSLETDLDLLGSTLVLSSEGNSETISPDIYGERLRSHFKIVACVSDQEKIIEFIGNIATLPKALLKLDTSGNSLKTAIHLETKGRNDTQVFLAKTVRGVDGNTRRLVGEVDMVNLWGVGHENTLPPMTEACVLDHTRNVLFGSFNPPGQVLHRISFESDSLETRSLEYTSDEKNFFVGYWPLFLRSHFEGPNLIIVLRNLQDDVFAPISHFKLLFPLTALLAFWVVLLLSIISIRKSMVPLEKLKEGAMRLARRDFDNRVLLTSGDEFQTLAETFNKSAGDLGRQFHAMEAMAEIDRSIHASLSTKTIINTVMKRMYSFFSCDTISFGLLDARKTDTVHMFTFSSPEDDTLSEKFLTITPEDGSRLAEPLDHFFFEVNNQSLSFLQKEAVQTARHFLVMPLYQNKSLLGIICLGHSQTYSYTEDDLAHARRLSNQVSAALSNANLVEELELLNWGTLEALARTVDAKSKWTAGHSERVAALAVRIARVIGCDAKSIDALHRAAFLHDIGKIGIPLPILDKPGKLTDEEYTQVKEHPAIGAKIIEPIEAYADAIPMILQHHERFDGKGYPHSLSGEELSLGARILAVADVYDALISSRPYRQGWVEENVIQLIVDESGKQFDPKVVDAFRSAVSWSIDGIMSESGRS